MATGVSIRLFRPEDAPALLAAALESVAEVGPWLSWCHAGLTEQDMLDWLRSQVAESAAGTAHEHAIVDAGGRLLGACGVNAINAEQRTANVGYWVRTSAAGCGVAPEAVSQLVAWAFSHTVLERLEIVCALGNTRSQRVAEKLGALREGILRSRLRIHGRQHDAVAYSLVRADLAPAGS